MHEWMSHVSGSEGTMLHGQNFPSAPFLPGTFALADALIAVACVAFAVVLPHVARKWDDTRFSMLGGMVLLFFFASGTRHLLAIWTLWQPHHGFNAFLSTGMAMAAMVSALLLWRHALQRPALSHMARLQVLHAGRAPDNEPSVHDANVAPYHSTNAERHEVQHDVQHDVQHEKQQAEPIAALQETERTLLAALHQEQAARADAQRLNRMYDDLLHMLSHDVRTPLNAVFGWTQLLRQRAQDAAMVTKGIDVIDRNVRAQTTMLEDALDTSAVLSGKVRLDLQPVDLAALVNAAVTALAPAAQAKEIQLAHESDASAGIISGDARRLQQVIAQLLGSAMKVTPKGGCITVQLARTVSGMVLRITDSGEDVAPEFLPLIFDYYGHADAPLRRRHGEGGGRISIGMSVVKRLVELHGGSVQAATADTGHGATMVVTLPLPAVQTDQWHDRRTPPHGVQRSGELPVVSGVRVLIVDDKLDARDLIKVLLEAHDAITASAASASDALAMLDPFRPDVVIVDIGMQHEKGGDLLREMRDRSVATPAIVLTTLARAEDRIRSMQDGYKAHLVKPVEPCELLTTIVSVIGRY